MKVTTSTFTVEGFVMPEIFILRHETVIVETMLGMLGHWLGRILKHM